MPYTEIYEPIYWGCENGCGWVSCPTRIEAAVSGAFLRLTFHCCICETTVARYYSMKQGGFVDVTGRILEDHGGRGNWNHLRYRGD